MDSPIMKSLVKVQDRLEENSFYSKPVSTGNVKLLSEITTVCEKSRNIDAKELNKLLKDPHFSALITTHDQVAETELEQDDQTKVEDINQFLPPQPPNGMPADAIRMVGLRRVPGEPLGLTVKVDSNSDLCIARILGGGSIDRQGLLHVGDVIKEVNGVEVHSAEDLHSEISKNDENLTFKIIPSYDDKSPSAQCYMRALYSYDPAEDSLLPCREIGLKFEQADILEIVDQSDPNWWQAKKIGSDSPAGLIPSQELEERRKAFVPPENDTVHKFGFCGTWKAKKKKKHLYQAKANSEFDRAELLLYEEVARMPPFKRKTLILVGAQGVGRRTLKNRIINSDANRYGTTVPHTSRPIRNYEQDGHSYYFLSREEFLKEIKNHNFLEYGEFNGHFYGTHMNTIRSVIRSGKICVLDCSPTALKLLHNSTEFHPFVVFLEPPGLEELQNLYEQGRTHTHSSMRSGSSTFDRSSSLRFSSRRARTLESLRSVFMFEESDLIQIQDESTRLQRLYEKYFDYQIVNEDFDRTFECITNVLTTLNSKEQWVPVSWIYGNTGKNLQQYHITESV